MHNMRWMMMLLVMLLLPVMAAADPVLPGPDALGLYFDPEAGSIDLSLLAPGSYRVDLILTRPTMEFITGWQVSFAIVGGAHISGIELPVGAIATANGPIDFAAAMSTPMPATMLTKLAVFTVESTVLENAQFYLGAVASPTVAGNLPCLQLPGGLWQQIGVASGDPTQPVASISTQTSVQSTSWGQVKGLFR
jgi:hypothetical protein